MVWGPVLLSLISPKQANQPNPSPATQTISGVYKQKLLFPLCRNWQQRFLSAISKNVTESFLSLVSRYSGTQKS